MSTLKAMSMTRYKVIHLFDALYINHIINLTQFHYFSAISSLKNFSNNKYSLTCFLRFHINHEKERQKVLHNHSKYQRLRGEIFTYFVLTCFTLLKFYNKVRKGHSMSAKNFKCAC